MNGVHFPIVIEVASASKDTHGQIEDASQMLFPGTLEQRKPGEWILYYKEIMDDEIEHTQMTHDVYLQIKDNHVTVLRKGPYSMMLVLEHGKRYQTDYHTPYGDMDIGVFPVQVQAKMGFDGGSVKLEYQLDVQGSYSGVRQVQLQYTATEGKTKPC